VLPDLTVYLPGKFSLDTSPADGEGIAVSWDGPMSLLGLLR